MSERGAEEVVKEEAVQKLTELTKKYPYYALVVDYEGVLLEMGLGNLQKKTATVLPGDEIRTIDKLVNGLRANTGLINMLTSVVRGNTEGSVMSGSGFELLSEEALRGQGLIPWLSVLRSREILEAIASRTTNGRIEPISALLPRESLICIVNDAPMGSSSWNAVLRQMRSSNGDFGSFHIWSFEVAPFRGAPGRDYNKLLVQSLENSLEGKPIQASALDLGFSSSPFGRTSRIFSSPLKTVRKREGD